MPALLTLLLDFPFVVKRNLTLVCDTKISGLCLHYTQHG